MNQQKFIIAATIPILVLLLGIGVNGQAKAWDDGGGEGGCCFGGGFHYWHHSWFHHWGCGYDCGGGGVGYQGCCQPQPSCCQSDDTTPSINSNQGTSVNVINSPGATVKTYQSTSTVLQPIVRGLCALTQVDCNSGQVGYNPGYQGP